MKQDEPQDRKLDAISQHFRRRRKPSERCKTSGTEQERVRPTHVPKRVERFSGVDFFGENDGGAALCTTPRKAVGRKTQQCRYRKYRTSRRERIEGGFTQFKACKTVPSRVSEEPSVSKRLSWREAGAKGHEHQPRWGVWVFWERPVWRSGCEAGSGRFGCKSGCDMRVGNRR